MIMKIQIWIHDHVLNSCQCKISWSWIHVLHFNDFMTYHDQFRYVFIYMKNIAKSYMKSAVPWFQLPVVRRTRDGPGDAITVTDSWQWSDMTKTAYAHSYCCSLPTRSKKCISVPFVRHQGWYIKFAVAPSRLRRRAALEGQGPGPASPPTVRRRLYRNFWIIVTMIGKSGWLYHPSTSHSGRRPGWIGAPPPPPLPPPALPPARPPFPAPDHLDLQQAHCCDGHVLTGRRQGPTVSGPLGRCGGWPAYYRAHVVWVSHHMRHRAKICNQIKFDLKLKADDKNIGKPVTFQSGQSQQWFWFRHCCSSATYTCLLLLVTACQDGCLLKCGCPKIRLTMMIIRDVGKAHYMLTQEIMRPLLHELSPSSPVFAFWYLWKI